MKATLENPSAALEIAAAPQETAPELCAAPTPAPHISLRPKKGWVSIDLRELWAYRELLWILALRDVRVRYKQTILGALWIILSPLITATIFTIIFGGLAQIPADGHPYCIFAFSGILLFNLFSHCTGSAVQSLVGNRHLISKVYFPRLIYPIAPAVSGLLDFTIGSCMLAIMMAFYHQGVRLTMLLLPPLVAEVILLGIGIGLWLGAMNVRWRDVGNLIPFLLQVWLYASPIVYPLSLARQKWPRGAVLIMINPMTGILEGFRWCLFGGAKPELLPILLAPALITVVVVGGLFYFRRMEQYFADLV